VQSEAIDKVNVPWIIVKMYYAAFYSAHCLLRIFGNSCSFFNPSDIRALVKLYEIGGLVTPFTLESGLYSCKLDAAASSLTCKKIGGRSGGSHETFWDEFGQRIGELAVAALVAPMSRIEAQDIFRKLTTLQEVMKQGGSSYSWLSYVRNAIQYRQQYEAWLPSSIKKVERNILCRLAGKWTADPLAIDMDLGSQTLRKFISACAFIIACCRVMLFHIAHRSIEGSKSFLNVGPLSILKEAGIAR
jgi:hypothetical protein